MAENPFLADLKRRIALRDERENNPAASESLQAELSNLNLYEIAANMGQERDPRNMSPTEWALHTGDYRTLEAMHGPEVARQLRLELLRIHDQMQLDRDAYRSNIDAVRDIAVGVPGAAVSSIYGIAAFGAGLASDEAGAYLTKLGETWDRDVVQRLQTDAINRRRRVDAARGAVIQRDNAAEAERMEAAGMPSWLATGIREGSNYVEKAIDSLQDPGLFTLKASESAGSMLAGAAVTKPLTAAGRAVVASRLGAVAARTTPAIASKFASKIGLNVKTGSAALGLGSIEIGGTYQSTMVDILSTKIDELERVSAPFREKVAELTAQGIPEDEAKKQARVWLANKAAKIAAGGTAALAIPLGFLGAGGARPTRVLRSYLKDVFFEGLEETGQEFFSQLAQNAVGRFVVGDESQDLFEGTGLAAGEAGIAGIASAGAMKGPRASLEALGLASKTARRVGSTISSKVSEISERRQAELNKNARLAGETMVARTTSLLGSTEENIARLHQSVDSWKADDEVKQVAKDQLENFARVLELNEQPSTFENLSDTAKARLSKVSNRTEAIREAAQLLNEAKDPEEQANLAFYLSQLIEPLEDHKEDHPYLQRGLFKKDKEALKLLRDYNEVIKNVTKIPEVKKALETVQKILEPSDSDVVLTEENLATPEGRNAVQKEITRALRAPETANAQNVATILKHASTGKISLTHSQQVGLKVAHALLDAREKLIAQRVKEAAEKQGWAAKTAERVINRHLLKAFLGNAGRVSAEITVIDEDPNAPSARGYAQQIVEAMRAGDTARAEELLREMGMFVQHMQNKVEALNKHFEDPSEPYVTYMQLLPRGAKGGLWAESAEHSNGRLWMDSGGNPISKYKGEFVNVKSAKSIAHAQEVAMEAKFVYDVFEALKQEFPELKVESPILQELNPALLGDPKELARKFREQRQQAPKKEQTAQATEPAAKPEKKQEQKQEQKKQKKKKKQNAEPKQKKESAAKAEPPAEPKTAPEQEAVAETPAEPETAPKQEAVAEAPVEEAEPKYSKNLSIKDVFRRLISNSRFTEFFNINKKNGEQPPTRTFLMKNPAEAVRRALTSQEALNDFLGKVAKGRLDRDVAQAYQSLLGSKGRQSFGGILSALNKNLNAALSVKGANGQTLGEYLSAGGPANEYIRGKVLNVLDATRTYNPELAELAVLAGLHWWLTHGQRTRPLHEEEVESIVGKETAGELDEDVLNQISQGLSLVDAIQSLSQTILRFWGLSPKADADLSFADGIPEAMAKEVLQALMDVGLFKRVEVDLRELLNRPDAQVIHRYVGIPPEPGNPIHSYPDAIEEVVVINPEQVSFFGDDQVPVQQHQLGNFKVRLGKKQITAIEHRQAEVYTPNYRFITFLQDLTKDGIISLWGTPIDEKAPYNEQHKASLEGQNLNLVSAFEQLQNDLQELENKAEAAGVDPENFGKKYQYVATSVNRFMMVGRYNPQASKIMRHSLMSTWSTIDVSDPDSAGYQGFMLATAQAFGIKVHKMSGPEAIRQATAKLNGPLRPALELLTRYIEGDLSPTELKRMPSELRQIMKDAGVDGTEVAVMALLEHAHLEAGTVDAKNFRTALYLEADGMTNGPFNTLGLLAAGKFTPNWVKAIGKGGAAFSATPRPAHTLDQEEKADLYETSTNHTKKHLGNLLQSLKAQKGARHLLRVNNNLSGVLSDLFPGGITMTEDQEGNLILNLKRNVAKNPLTITVYGSGTQGIANKLTKIIINEYYAKVSLAAQAVAEGKQPWEGVYPNDPQGKMKWDRLHNALHDITRNRVGHSKRKGTYWTEEDQSANFLKRKPNPSDLKSFTKLKLTKQELGNLQVNMKHLFVDPMVKGIEDTMGASIFATRNLMRDATRMQAIVFRKLYHDAINEAIAKKRKRLNIDPKRSVFLSRKELDEVWDSLRDVAPYITVDGQPFLIVKRKALEAEARNKSGTNYAFKFSRSLRGDMETPANIPGPADPGVAAIPFMVQGLGDGRMMREIYQKPAPNTLDVYDGLNMPIDKISEYGQRANEAALYAWRTGNLIWGIEESFTRFWMNPKVQKAISEMSDTLVKEFFIEDSVSDFISDLRARLESTADSIATRQEVLAQVPISIDQMAGASAPYVSEGTIEIPETATPEEVAGILNKLYLEALPKVQEKNAARRAKLVAQIKERHAENARIEKELEERAKEIEANIAPQVRKKPSPALAPIFAFGRKDKSGVRILSSKRAITQMVKALNLTPQEKVIITQLLRSKAMEGYQFVVGSRAEILAYQQARKLNSMPEGETGERVFGFTVPSEKTIYLMTDQVETVVHEMIHAATFATILAYYEGQDLGPNAEVTKEAITRLEGLMELFLETNFQTEGDVELERALTDAANTIVAAMENTDLTEAQRKAVALNEFMAWSLANRTLSEQLQHSYIPNTIKGKLVRIAQSAYRAIKKLIWGRKEAPKWGADVLSQIQFNTAIVMRAQPNIAEIAREVAMKHAILNDQPGRERLRELREAFTQKIIDPLVRQTQVRPDLDARLPEHARPRMIATELKIEAQRHFQMDPEEASTFRVIVDALSTAQEIAPNAMIEAHNLFIHFLKTVQEHDLRPEGMDEQNAAFKANQRFNFLLRRTRQGRDVKGRSAMLPVFMALALTNTEFRSILSRMEVPKTAKTEGRGLDGVLENLGNQALDKLSDLVSGADRQATNVRDALDALGSSITQDILKEQEELSRRFSISGVTNAVNEYLTQEIGKLADLVAEPGENLKESRNKLKRFTGRVMTSFAGLISEKHGKIVAEEFVGLINRTDGMEAFRDVIRDLVGRLPSNALIYDMVKWVHSTVGQLRQDFRDKVPVVIKSKFKTEPTIKQLTALHRAMGRSDLAALLDRMSAKKVLELAIDRERIVEEATKLENQIKQKEPRLWKHYLRKIDQYVKYVNEGIPGHNLLRNAHAIAHLFQEGVTPKGWKPSQELVQDIDQLLTLRLLDTVPQKQFEAFAELVKNEPEGMEFTLNYLQGQRKTELKKVKAGKALVNHWKGYLPTELNQRASLLVMDDSKEDELRLLGYTRIGTYEGSGLESDLTKGYYYSPDGGTRPAFNQGIIQNVKQTGYGIHLGTGFSTGPTAGVITNPTRIAKILRHWKHEDSDAVEGLMPIFDENGEVVAFERSIAPEMYNLIRQEEQDLAKMIGYWRGRQLEEELAKDVNRELLKRSKKMYDQAKSEGKLEEYIDVFKSTDPIHQDAVKLFTPEFIEMIKEVYGTNADGSPRFYVRRDMLNDVIGYRQASIGDFWTGNSRYSKETQKFIKDSLITVLGTDAYRKLVWAEQNWQSVVQSVRTNIVVRSIIVPTANTLSGILQLAARGVPFDTIAKGLGGKLVEIEFYTKSLMRKVELEAELRANEENPFNKTRIQAELQDIEDQHRRLSIWPLIAAGEFSTIADVGLTVDDLKLASGNVMEVLAKKVDELPPMARALARQGYMARDTSLFRALQKSVQYSDFLMKAVYYDHLTKKKGMKSKDALAKITEEFNNYDLATGRFRGYLESIGMAWFLNYSLRSTKIAIRMLRENPLHVLLMSVLPHPSFGLGLGTPLTDNIFARLFEGTLGFSFGPWMMLDPIGINTWLNLATE